MGDRIGSLKQVVALKEEIEFLRQQLAECQRERDELASALRWIHKFGEHAAQATAYDALAKLGTDKEE